MFAMTKSFAILLAVSCALICPAVAKQKCYRLDQVDATSDEGGWSVVIKHGQDGVWVPDNSVSTAGKLICGSGTLWHIERVKRKQK